MSAVSKLIDVQYNDLTNYNDVVNDVDVMGCPFFYHWGPVDRLMLVNQSQFLQYFPTSIQSFLFKNIDFENIDSEGKSSKITFPVSDFFNSYRSYANILKGFSTGVQYAEVVRIPGMYNLLYTSIPKDSIDELEEYVSSHITYGNVNSVSDITLSDVDNVFYIGLKYPGIIPPSLINGASGITVVIDTVKSEIDESQTLVRIKVDAQGGTNPTLEEFIGSFDRSATEDGRKISIVDDINNNSNLISINADEKPLDWGKTTSYKITFDLTATKISSFFNTDIFSSTVNNSVYQIKEDKIVESLNKYSDTLASDSTILTADVNFGDAVKTNLSSIAKARQDLIAVIGYPVNNSFTKDAIKSYKGKLSNDKFSVFLAAREQYLLFNRTLELDCTGGWIGNTFSTAKGVRLNQPASAFTYGGYSGTIIKSLSFDDVSDLHDEGICSIFTSYQGPLIWGIRTLYPRKSSYFAKLNVMRVLSYILRQWFPIALSAIHTDAASNSITRAGYNTRFNEVLRDLISSQDLASDSYANCEGEINSDLNTRGGSIFNVVANLHFYGLVERIKVVINATDSSVSAEVTE